jgi:hypothetical protein
MTAEVEELPYPHTLPNDASGYEMMRVIENQNEHTEDSCGIHVALSDSFDYISSWGTYLGDVVLAIAEQYAYHYADGDVLKALVDIRDGLLSSLFRNELRVAEKKLGGQNEETTAE